MTDLSITPPPHPRDTVDSIRPPAGQMTGHAHIHSCNLRCIADTITSNTCSIYVTTAVLPRWPGSSRILVCTECDGAKGRALIGHAINVVGSNPTRSKSCVTRGGSVWFLVPWARFPDCAPTCFTVMQIRVTFALHLRSLVPPHLVLWAAASVAYPSIRHCA